MTIVMATHSQYKVREIERVLARAKEGFLIKSLLDLGVTQAPKETGVTFLENARIKARAAMEATGLPALADDSGLCAEALGGAPGVWSSDYDIPWLLEKMKDMTCRRAYFICQLALIYPAGGDAPAEREVLAEGRCYGEILRVPRGDNGFGYDPVFLPDGHMLSAGELTPEEKDKVSHRGRALRELAGKMGWF
jgi:XTP/dITP diphosphohydrolase